jgi:hypothetical protein
MRLNYSHVVVLDNFFGEAERQALLDHLTAPGWDHTQVRASFAILTPAKQAMACMNDDPFRVSELPSLLARCKTAHFIQQSQSVSKVDRNTTVQLRRQTFALKNFYPM